MPTERSSITVDWIREKIFEKDIEIWSKRESTYRQNKSSMFSVVLGQCSEAMRAKLESETSFKNILNDSDVIKLLELIRNIAFAYKSKRYPYLAVYTSVKTLYSYYQHHGSTHYRSDRATSHWIWTRGVVLTVFKHRSTYQSFACHRNTDAKQHY